MATQSVTIQLPGPLYQQLRRRAEQSRRSVEDEVLEALAVAVPESDELPPELAEAISALALLDDDSLRLAARSHFSTESAEQLESLHEKRRTEGLTPEEERHVALLVRQYERAMLVRAHAARLLHERGHDVSHLLDDAA